jgi:hypothetical protein
MAKKESHSTALLIGFAIIAIGGFLLYKQKMQPSANNNTPAANNRKYPIALNAYNEDIKPLQAVIGVTQDGFFGQNTIAALKQYGYDYTIYPVINSPDEIQTMINRINIYAGN